MKITCQSCQAKYTIADDKVLGKIVKIRCKKCSATIVVNGNDPAGTTSVPPTSAEPAALGAPADEWTVNVAEGDQRNLTTAEIAPLYQSGVIGNETFCWRDGMNDWLPLREIDALFEACNATRAVPNVAALGAEAARVREKGGASNRPVAGPREYAAASAGNGTPNGGSARTSGSRAPGADLFRGAAQAGSEEEVMTSAPAGVPQAYDANAPKPTLGARNETSVLFSLSALTSKGSDRPPAVPGSEASGLIDIRQLSAQMAKVDDRKSSRVDDIMNLSSGGAFNAALSAPILAPPSLDQYGPGAAAAAGAAGPSMAPGKSKALIFLALGAGAFVIVAAVGATTLLMRKGSDTENPAASAGASASAAESAAAATTASAGPAGSETAPAATATETAQAAAAPTTTAAAPTATAAQAPAPVAAAPAAAAPAVHHEEHHAAPAAVEAEQPFNMGEARARLAAAAAATQSCKKPDGPTGTGHMVVVFAPSGAVQSATVSGPPFEGTPTGACAAARFRAVHVPAFSGSPFSASKSFTIN